MKKPFLFGVLFGCLFSILANVGYNTVTNHFLKRDIIPIDVQQQVVRNIQDMNALLFFADNTLIEYTNSLMDIREILIKTEDHKYLSQEDNKRIVSLSGKSLQIIEEALFNTIPVFGNNQNEEYCRIIPVTLDVKEPTYKICISCMGFNENVIKHFIKDLTPEIGIKRNVVELDKIIAAVSLERAQLGAYMNRLAYSQEIATVLSINNVNERQVKLNVIIQKMKNEQLILCAQSANGIYCFEDRQQIQLKYDELNKELQRINVSSHKSIENKESISLLSQPAAEAAMLKLVKKI